MAKQEREMYLIRFKPKDGFRGWNYVYARNKNEADRLLKERVGKALYDDIDWSTLLTGIDAEAASKALEREYRAMFD